MKKEDMAFLNQLLNSAEETVLKLEKSQENKDHILFDKAKRQILEIQKQISALLK